MAWFGAISLCGKAKSRKKRESGPGKGKKKGRKAERGEEVSGAVRQKQLRRGREASREDSWEGEGRRDGREERKTKTPVMLHFLLGKTPKGALEFMLPPQTSKDPGPAPTPAKHQTPFPQGQA